MTILRPRSLQLRLATRLGALFFVATLLVVSAVLYQAYQTAEELSMRGMFEQARNLAESLERDHSLPSTSWLVERDKLQRETLFAIRDRDGEVLAASDDRMLRLAGNRSDPGRRPDFFRLESFGEEGRNYHGVAMRLRSRVGPVTVMVAETEGREYDLLYAMLGELAWNAAWIISLFVAATLLVGVFAIRGGLRPLRETADQAATIKPEAMSVRLGTENLPSEVLPFMHAVNRALDRLEEGFALQRQFTANAAHELRTPLAIITAALDEMQGNGKVNKLQEDVARMNRLVNQLLHVARLDSVELDVTGDVDLRACAREVVEYMAPLAIDQDRSLALTGMDRAVMIKGNRHAVGDALRNLIENALVHTPAHSEVLVEVAGDGSVSVRDQGAGVRPEDREHIFDRFWHARGAPGGGAGLGLSIVMEIMKMHGGTVEITDNSDRGACFTLRFRPCAS